MASQDSNLQFDIVPSTDFVKVGVPERGGTLPQDPSPARMPVFDITSTDPLPQLSDQPTRLPVPSSLAPGHRKSATANAPTKSGLWLQGDVLMCGCPDCLAPMTVRTWLMIADCWNCRTSIELSEEQERDARRLLRERDEQKEHSSAPSEDTTAKSDEQPTQQGLKTPATTPRETASSEPPPSQEPTPLAAPSAPPSRRSAAERSSWATTATAPIDLPTKPDAGDTSSNTVAKETPPPPPSGRWAHPPRDRNKQSTGPPPAARPTPPPARRRATDSSATRRRRAAVGPVQLWINELFRMTPAWLVSLVFHFVALTLLALIPVPDDDDEGAEILLSQSVSKDREGGEVVKLDPQDDAEFDLPVPDDLDLTDPEVKQALLRANQDALELRVDPDTIDPMRPELADVKTQIGSRNAHRSLAARDPRVRVEMVEREGGTTLTEAAVARALRWLAEQQRSDGGWTLRGGSSDTAATALALLPFLGAGQTHLNGVYQQEVSGGLRWLVEHQDENGDLRDSLKRSNDGMYAHGQATIVLCEAFAMEGDERLRAPAQKAVDFIVAAQHSAGGWRYQPKQPGDTSVVGWQLMALQSARAAGLSVPDSTLSLADQFLDGVASHEGSRYSYIRRGQATPAMTAEALLCRMYLGWNRQQPGLEEGLDWLLEEHMPSANAPHMYYWYYATQTFHHAGGEHWKTWNRTMRDILVRTQERRGDLAGSWTPRGGHASRGGRIYMTALAACSLEVYYRHLPIFRQIDID